MLCANNTLPVSKINVWGTKEPLAPTRKMDCDANGEDIAVKQGQQTICRERQSP